MPRAEEKPRRNHKAAAQFEFVLKKRGFSRALTDAKSIAAL